jgi:crotonobetainyl-CoA:carnitine CoA-transferase CaiB-like acyl-CoA transferase
VCLTPINDLDELAADPYLNERKMFVDFDLHGKIFKTIASPVRFASTGEGDDWIAPALGEDTYTILREAAWDDTAIKTLITQNIIKT